MLGTVDLIDLPRLPELALGMGLDAFTVAALALLILRRSNARATQVFSIVVVNMVVFFATYVMSTASIGANVGFGLFALFGILRFRTGTLPVLEMTYLFAAIALAAFNALAVTTLTLVEAIIANLVVVVVLELLGGLWLEKQPQAQSIIYERVDLLHPDRRHELIEDLRDRTGLEILGVAVGDINFLNDTAKLTLQVKPAAPNAFLVHAESDQFDP